MQNNITKAFQERIAEIMGTMGDHTTSFEITMSAAVDEVATISYKIEEYATLETLSGDGHWRRYTKEDTDETDRR